MAQIKSAIQEVRDQLFLDRADGEFLSVITDNLGLPRPDRGFASDDLWRAIVRRLALDTRQVENVFRDLLALIFGPQKTVTTVLSQDVSIADEQLTIADQLRIPQLGTMVIEEGGADEETIEYSFRDPRNGLVDLKTAAVNAHTALNVNAESYLTGAASATDTSIVVKDPDDFPSTFPFQLLLSSGLPVEEVVQVTGLSTDTGDSFAFASPIITLTDAGAAWTTALIGTYVRIVGSTTPANNGTFRIRDVPTPTTMEWENINGVAEAFPGTWTLLHRFDTSALVNNHAGPTVSSITSGYSTVSASGAVLTINDSSRFPTSGLIRVQEDGGTPLEDIRYTINDLVNDQLQLENKLIESYTNAEVTLLREGASVQLAQVQVKGAGWDIFQTEPRVLRIFLPESFEENRLLDVAFIHGPILNATPTTVSGAHSIGDRILTVADASTFPDSGIVLINGVEKISYTILRLSTKLIPQGLTTGSIITPAGASYAADPPGGETFTLDDGVNSPTVFEFDQDSSVVGTNVAITMTGTETVAQMAVLIRDAINGVGSFLNIVATLDSVTVGKINLTNEVYGPASNVAIVETVADAGFIVAGMSTASSGDLLPIGAMLLHVEDVTPIKSAEMVTKDLILSRGTGSSETVTWTSINEKTNTITLTAGVVNAHTPVEATGSITTIVSASHVDTETLTIDDGINTATVFEFDNNSTVTAGRIPIDITGAVSADVMRDRIIAAINSQSATLFVGASNGGAATVSLQNRNLGTAGNVAILESVANAGFIVAGMSGGTDEGTVEVVNPGVNDLRLLPPAGLVSAYVGGESVAVIEEAYGGTDLENGQIFDATDWPTANNPAVADDLFSGPYVWSILDRVAESTKSTLNEDIAGPTFLVASQRSGRTALEVKNAALFNSNNFQQVRIGRNLAGNEIQQINDITLIRDVASATINAAATAGDLILTVSAASGLPDANGYRLFIGDNVSGNGEEVVLVKDFSGTTVTLDPTTPLVFNHSVGDSIQLMADVLTVDALAFDHAGFIKLGDIQKLVPLIGTDWLAGTNVVGSPNERYAQIEEVRSYIDIVSAASFSPAGGYAQINFGRNLIVVESQLTVDETAGSTTIDVNDGSIFPTADFFIHIGMDTRIIETVKADLRIGNTITLTPPASNALLYSHKAGEWVRYFPGDREQIVYTGTETGGPNERLTFSSEIRFKQDHLEGEAVAVSDQIALPDRVGNDYPLYLPSRWQDRIEFLIDLARAAGVKVLITSDR